MTKTLNIHQRINAVMQDIAYVQKEDKKVNNQYKFVSHDAVTAAVRPHLVTHGITVIASVANHNQDGNRTEVDLVVNFHNIDDPSDTVSVNVFGYGVDQQDKGPGKAFSYAKKYAFLQTFCLETGDDPERQNIDHVADQTTEKPKVKLISLEHYKILQALIDTKKNVDVQKMCQHYKITALAELPIDRYKSAYDALNAKEDK
jgi:hypothetical protein